MAPSRRAFSVYKHIETSEGKIKQGNGPSGPYQRVHNKNGKTPRKLKSRAEMDALRRDAQEIDRKRKEKEWDSAESKRGSECNAVGIDISDDEGLPMRVDHGSSSIIELGDGDNSDAQDGFVYDLGLEEFDLPDDELPVTASEDPLITAWKNACEAKRAELSQSGDTTNSPGIQPQAEPQKDPETMMDATISHNSATSSQSRVTHPTLTSTPSTPKTRMQVSARESPLFCTPPPPDNLDQPSIQATNDQTTEREMHTLTDAAEHELHGMTREMHDLLQSFITAPEPTIKSEDHEIITNVSGSSPVMINNKRKHNTMIERMREMQRNVKRQRDNGQGFHYEVEEPSDSEVVKTQLDDLKKQNAALRETSTEAERKVASVKRAHKDTQKKLDDVTLKLASYKNDTRQLQKQGRDDQQRLANLKEQLQQAKCTNEDHERELAKLRKDLKEKATRPEDLIKIAELEDKLKGYEAEWKNLQQARDIWKGKEETLESEIARLNRYNAEQTAKIVDQQQQIDAMKSVQAGNGRVKTESADSRIIASPTNEQFKKLNRAALLVIMNAQAHSGAGTPEELTKSISKLARQIIIDIDDEL